MDPIQQLALVSEVSDISASELSRTSAALQKQLTRDFGPTWSVNATIDSFSSLEDVPLTYWPVLVQADIHVAAAGVHEDKNGQPFALVQYSNAWTLTASHEMLEMSADPFGRRLIQSQSLKEDQGRVEYVVEVCDPCEAPELGYQVNGILVSDFYTPHYFDPASTTSSAVRYSLTGAITKPREVLRGGYLSWHDPVSDHWWQSTWFSGDAPTFKDLGTLDGGRGSLRAQVDHVTPVPMLVEGLPEGGAVLARAASGSSEVERSAAARAEALRMQIAELKRAAGGAAQ